MPTMPQTFRPPHAAAKQELTRLADKLRGSPSKRGYDFRWRQAALAYLKKHRLCCGCLAVDRTELAVLVDHIIPHFGDRVLFWDSNNWQPACRWCHDAVKSRLEHLFTSGQCTAEDLKLNSEKAVEIYRRQANLELAGNKSERGGGP